MIVLSFMLCWQLRYVLIHILSVGRVVRVTARLMVGECL